MKSRNNMQTKSFLTSEQKWAIGTCVFPGVLFGGVAGSLNVFMDTPFEWVKHNVHPCVYTTRRLPYPAGEALMLSWDKYGLLGGSINPRLLKYSNHSIPAVTVVATCGAIGFFSRKAYSAWKKSYENESKNTLTSKNP